MSRSFFALVFFSMPFCFAEIANAQELPLHAMLDHHRQQPLFYPPAEGIQRHNGNAQIACTISAEGIAENCTIQYATAPDFGLAAVQMAMGSHFLPAYRDQKPVQSVWEQTFTFTLPNYSQGKPILDRSRTPRPVYPLQAEIQNTAGRIKVTCHVLATGVAQNCVASNGPTILQQAAIAYFTMARYFPALQNGKAIDAAYSGSLDWDLDKDFNDGFE